MTLQNDLDFIKQLATAAGEVVLHQYGHVARLTKTHIATTDEAVTEADRASQRLIIAGLRKQFPNDGIIGEESDSGQSITFDVKDVAGRNWVIDPIDGTNNFIAGMGAFAVCIGLLENGYPVLGVVLDVTRGQMYAAAKGVGAFVNDRPIRAISTPLSDSSMLMMTSNLLDKNNRAPNWACRWISQTVWKVRILGSAALEAIQVAAGVAHGAVTCNGKLWDVAAPAAIVLEAGGLITDLSGKPIFPFDLRNYVGAKVPFLAAAPTAQAELLKELGEYP
jgi:myo-inositol-1(or 4)-monophosphatase